MSVEEEEEDDEMMEAKPGLEAEQLDDEENREAKEGTMVGWKEDLHWWSGRISQGVNKNILILMKEGKEGRWVNEKRVIAE